MRISKAAQGVHPYINLNSVQEISQKRLNLAIKHAIQAINTTLSKERKD